MSERRAAHEASLPVGWKQVSLGQLLEAIETGKSFAADSTPPDLNQVGVMKVSAVTWGAYDETESKTVHDPAQVNPKFFVKPGDLLFSRANTIDLVGAVVLVDRVTRCVMLSDKILRFCMPQEFKKWTLWALRSQLGRRQIELLATGNQESMRNIGQDRIRQILIPLPPPLERDRIVSAIETQFSRLDDAVASLKRAKANVKRVRASVLKAAVEGRLVPTEAALARAEGRDYEPASTLLTRILTERRARWAQRGAKGKYREPAPPTVDAEIQLPSGWIWASVDQVSSEVCDGDHQPPPVVETGVPFLVIGDVKSGAPRFENCRFVSEDYYGKLDWKRRPDSHDILYTVVGSLGIPVSIPTDRPFCVQRHIAILKSPAESLRPYLLCALGSEFVFRQAVKKATGTAQKTLGLNRLREIVLPIPPLAEQRRIVAEVDRRLSVLDALDATLDANLARCAKLRQSILKRAFEGKLVRPDAPAAAAPQLPLFTEEAAP